jgi:pimeloyl-ACP methyl ester carboxylesterase
MYQVKRASHSHFVPIRHLRYHYRSWGAPQPGVPPLVLVHGWMDVGASFQFMVDALAQDRWIVAPDWRGFGLTSTPNTDNFWFADYLGDLDALLDLLAPGQAVDLVGHSMGGHIATMYAGVRPERIRRLVNLEGFGLAGSRPAQAPTRYAQWLDELAKFGRGDMDLRSYPSHEAVVARLMKTNPRLSLDKAQWLAGEWSEMTAPDQWQVLGHAAHKVVGAHLFQVDEAIACYQRITAPTLFVHAQEDSLQTWWKNKFTRDEFMQRVQHIPNLSIECMDDVGHMLHHDQPETLAIMIEAFLAR